MDRPRPVPPAAAPGAAVKLVEYFWNALGRNAGAVVGDGEGQFAVADAGGDFHGRAGGSVGGGVEQQIGQRLFHQHKIHQDERHFRREHDVEFAAGQFFLNRFDGDVDEVADVAPVQFWFDVAGFDAGDVEQIADQAVEPGDGLLDFADQGRGKPGRTFRAGSDRPLAALVMAAMGVRISWEMESSRVLPSRSDSAARWDCWAASWSRWRSSTSAACRANASSRFFCSRSGGVVCGSRTPRTPSTPAGVARGR